MITQTKLQPKTIIFLGDPQDLQRACEADSEKTNFKELAENFLKLQTRREKAYEFIRQSELQLRDLKSQLWDQITNYKGAQLIPSDFPLSKAVAKDGNLVLLARATHNRDIQFEEVYIDV